MSDTALNHVPLTTADLVKDVNLDDPAMAVDLNRIQASHIQDALRTGAVTPEQVTEWKQKNGLASTVLPATVAVPAAETNALGGRTDKDAPRLADVVQRNFELTHEQQRAAAEGRSPNPDTTGI